MENFIKIIDKTGITERLVKAIQKVNGIADASSDAIETILKLEMIRDDSLYDTFIEDCQNIGLKIVSDYIKEQVSEEEKN